MTQDTPAHRARSPRRPTDAASSVRRRGLATSLLIGGGLLGCVAAGFALTLPQGIEPSPAPVLAAKVVRQTPALRVLSAPDERRFGSGELVTASMTTPAAQQKRAKLVAVAHSAAVHPKDGKESVHPLASAAAENHRFDPAGASRWAAFVPATPAVVLASTQASDLGAERSGVTASSSVASGIAKPSVEIASLEEEHVEVALPDLPADALDPPQSARDALERELALAVPRPTARPYREPSAVAPVLRQRSRAPAGLLAYARPDAGALDDEPSQMPQRSLPPSPAIGAGTAVYDISASTVYLPNGERLEAHSGLGSLRDDVRYVHVKNRGATPPHTYNLTMRESLFHGVAAIRLTPIGGERKIHNRNGLLAHTYMLGPRGDSNGCVSFKDYKRFLAAFKRGEIKRLVVVPSYKNPTSRIASIFGMGKR